MKSVCPWNLELSRNEWCFIPKYYLTNEQVLAMARRVPRVLTNSSPSPLSCNYLDEENHCDETRSEQ